MLSVHYNPVSRALLAIMEHYVMTFSWELSNCCGSLIHHLYTSSRGLVGLVATKSQARYLLGGTGWDWVRIPLGLNFSGSAGGVSGHAQSLTGLPED